MWRGRDFNRIFQFGSGLLHQVNDSPILEGPSRVEAIIDSLTFLEEGNLRGRPRQRNTGP